MSDVSKKNRDVRVVGSDILVKINPANKWDDESIYWQGCFNPTYHKVVQNLNLSTVPMGQKNGPEKGNLFPKNPRMAKITFNRLNDQPHQPTTY